LKAEETVKEREREGLITKVQKDEIFVVNILTEGPVSQLKPTIMKEKQITHSLAKSVIL